jgi:cellulose synthase/poly-beta-1,6-N-acetylglucosamine synthase-like glycosyltransferase
MSSPRKQPFDGIRLFVATPMYDGTCRAGYWASCLALQRMFLEVGGCVRFGSISGRLVDDARNLLVSEFRRSDSTHLLFIDADIIFDPKDVLRLLAADKEIIGGLYPKKIIDWDQVRRILRTHPDASDDVPARCSGMPMYPLDGVHEPVECEWIPGGFMLIRRAVISALAEGSPMYYTGSPSLSQEKRFVFDFGVDERGEYITEDVSLCRKARRAGFRVWVLPDVVLGHVGPHTFRSDLPQLARLQL